MQLIQIELPDKISTQLDEMVRNGWFRNKEEIIRFSITEFARLRRLDLQKQFQEEDIKWALEQKKVKIAHH